MPFLPTATPAGYALQPVRSTGGAPYNGGAEMFPITAAITIGKGHIVVTDASGVLSAAAGSGLTALNGTIVGVCDGVEYIDSSGRLVETTGLTSGVAGSAFKLRVITDPNVVYKLLVPNASASAVISATGVQPSLGSCTFLSGVTNNNTSLFATGVGTTSTISQLGTVALKIVGVDPQSITEAGQSVPTGLYFCPEVLVKINPNLHIATASTGI
jgi:hypothetical protein